MLVHILHYLVFVAICYAHNKFCYSGSDAVYPRYRVFPFPVYEKAYSCLAIVCPRMVL